MSVTPDFVGQIYKDTTTGNLWRANSLTAGDWTLELQNGQIKWNPRTIKLHEVKEFSAYVANPPLTGITDLVLEWTTSNGPIDIEACADLITVSIPNLITLTSDAYFFVLNCANLVSITCPMLQSCNNGITILNSGITSLDLTSYVDNGSVYGLEIGDCHSLTTLSMPNYIPTNGQDQKLYGLDLDSNSVNAFLARCVANASYVSGTINLYGSASPTGQGLTDVATLQGRGVIVNL